MKPLNLKSRRSVESYLIIDDATSDTLGTELRDGVAIDSKTRTADEGALFNMELLEAGATFNLHFELALPDDEKNQ